MTSILIEWSVPNLTEVITLYDVQKVYRSTTGPTGSFSEITDAVTRVTLVAGQESYSFIDTAGAATYYYAVSYYNSSTTAESSQADPVMGSVTGYIDIQDIRDEGFTETMVPDSDVTKAILRANALIERMTKRWFEARTLTFRLDGNGKRVMRFSIPLIKLTSITIDDVECDVDSFKVYNRHLTQRLLGPDDRADPKLEWNLIPYTEGIWAEGVFTEGQQNIVIEGVWGYTELTSSDPVGETSEGSQVPLHYGRTPELIKLAALLLTIAYMYPQASDDAAYAAVASRIIKESTFDQSYELSEPSEESLATGAICNTIARDILRGFTAQPGFEAV